MKKSYPWRYVASLLLCLISPVSQALHCQSGDLNDSANGTLGDCPVASAVFTYDWQGVLTAFDSNNDLLPLDAASGLVPLSGTLNYDALLGTGTLTVNNPDLFGLPSVWQPVSLQSLNDGNLLTGTASVLWNDLTLALPFAWDAAGLLGASRVGGDILMGAAAAAPCYQTAGCGNAFPGIPPFSGPAFMATLDDQPGGGDGISGIMSPAGPAPQPSWNLDIYQLTPVPLPAAAWLFVSGLAALVGLNRRGRRR